ncbi:MAG TPA: hypothetical protein VGE42_01570 [Candidatus Dormibacteraeota bacterium]
MEEVTSSVCGHRLHAYLRAVTGARASRIGPFLMSFDEHDANLFHNYAVPDDDADPICRGRAGADLGVAPPATVPSVSLLERARPRPGAGVSASRR